MAEYDLYINQSLWYRNRFSGEVESVPLISAARTYFSIEYRGKEYFFAYDSIGVTFRAHYHEIINRKELAGNKYICVQDIKIKGPRDLPIGSLQVGSHLYMLDPYTHRIRRVYVCELHRESFCVSCSSWEEEVRYDEVGEKVFFDEYELRQKTGLRHTETAIDKDVAQAFANTKFKRRDTNGTTINRTSTDFAVVADAYLDYVSPNDYHASLEENLCMG